MAVDLGLDIMPREGNTRLHLSCRYQDTVSPTRGGLINKEACRAYLGCYYLSTAYVYSFYFCLILYFELSGSLMFIVEQLYLLKPPTI